MIEFLLGSSAGFLAAWIYFKRAGLLRTRGEFELARIFGDEIVGMKSMQTASEIQAPRQTKGKGI